MAGISFGVLGNGETCTGDPARRAGNEFVFQGLAQQNVETFKEFKVKKVVSTCAHCFNTLKNEYKDFGVELEVVHHTQLLNRLVREGKLTPVKDGAGAAKRSITYHDPCYLGRHNEVYTPPRELLQILPGAEVIEMERNSEKSFCCGAGGARMWMEENIGERINLNRTKEAVGTGADQIAVGCPFCRVMLSDGLTAQQAKGEAREEVEVLDVAQMLLASVKGEQATKAAPGSAAAAATPPPPLRCRHRRRHQGRARGRRRHRHRGHRHRDRRRRSRRQGVRRHVALRHAGERLSQPTEPPLKLWLTHRPRQRRPVARSSTPGAPRRATPAAEARRQTRSPLLTSVRAGRSSTWTRLAAPAAPPRACRRQPRRSLRRSPEATPSHGPRDRPGRCSTSLRPTPTAAAAVTAESVSTPVAETAPTPRHRPTPEAEVAEAPAAEKVEPEPVASTEAHRVVDPGDRRRHLRPRLAVRRGGPGRPSSRLPADARGAAAHRGRAEPGRPTPSSRTEAARSRADRLRGARPRRSRTWTSPRWGRSSTSRPRDRRRHRPPASRPSPTEPEPTPPGTEPEPETDARVSRPTTDEAAPVTEAPTGPSRRRPEPGRDLPRHRLTPEAPDRTP